MKKKVTDLLIVCLVFLAGIQIAGAQTQTSLPSVNEILNPDGTPRLNKDGAYRLNGMEMKLSEEGKPVFSTKAGGGGVNDNPGIWHTGFELPNGLDNGARCMIEYNGELYVGGYFTSVNGMAANYIARWDGTDWNTLGSGIENGVTGGEFNEVVALAIYNGELYVAGKFLQAGGIAANNIARWDGTDWQPVGTGANNGISGSASRVYSLHVFNGELYAGGEFAQAGGVTTNNIARWNGSGWASVGSGNANGVNYIVEALQDYNNELYIGGWFTQAGGIDANQIAKWNGTAWSRVGTAANNGVNSGFVRALKVYNNELYVGGDFTQAAVSDPFTNDGIDANRIARWNGNTWNSAGVGTANGLANGWVNTFYEQNNEILIGGFFAGAGGLFASNIAIWDGADWNSFGTPGQDELNSSVSAILSYNNELFFAGSFSSSGQLITNYLSRWDGNNWNTVGIASSTGMGINNVVYSIAVYNGDLYVGGAFTEAGGINANRIARWDGTSWHALGTGSSNGISGTNNPFIYTMTVYNGELYVGGRFTEAGGISANYIARWNGTTWNSVGTGTENGVQDPGVTNVAILAVYNGELYVGGVFTQAGTVNANSIARWNGASWNSLGSGPSNGVSTSFNYQSVSALAVHNGMLYVGGYFTNAGGINANYIASWDGTNWGSLGSGLGNGVDGSVQALTSFNNELYMGGFFSNAGGLSAQSIARWNGSAWATVGSGNEFLMGENVYCFAEFNGQLYVGGNFKTINSIDVNYVASWNGSAWSKLTTSSGTGINTYLLTLGVHDNSLVLGGQMTQVNAGDSAILSSRIAKWTSLMPTSVTGMNADNEFTIFPNPNHGLFTVQTEQPGVFDLMDISGKLISTYNINGTSYVIREKLPHGLYFIRERASGKSRKLVVE